ncbi:hypothetical protein FHT98_5224 [Bosea sp. AK1]|jgi:uncharacterized protein YciI|uniref:YciI family protein n=1 Tax=Bosea sp. AK1 TaxID=2587160 RepID=UPI001153D6C3|nr:YciI family protein [Bosea sp. AK1]TQI65338.1 hypothetical protein FHT98_5224 [Bosea sp. AK1]
MLYVTHCLDKSDTSSIRQANHAAHREHLGSAPVNIVVAGPLVADDGETPIGSLFIVEAESQSELEAFHKADPLWTEGVWGEMRIHAFLKRVDRR